MNIYKKIYFYLPNSMVSAIYSKTSKTFVFEPVPPVQPLGIRFNEITAEKKESKKPIIH